MRAVFIGTGKLAVATMRLLLKRGYEVVVVERDKEAIDALVDDLDCGFVHGDGSRPAILREVNPRNTDVLYALTNDDQDNIIASLVGRSLGFKRVVTKIEDMELEHICLELGLEDTIIPTRTISGYLADMFEGRDPLQLSTMIRDEARTFSFVARREDEGPLCELALPEESRVICVYRDNNFILPDADIHLKRGDEVVLISHRRNLEALERHFQPSE